MSLGRTWGQIQNGSRFCHLPGFSVVALVLIGVKSQSRSYSFYPFFIIFQYYSLGIPCRNATRSHDDCDNFDGQPHSPMAPIHFSNHLKPFLHPTIVNCISMCNTLTMQVLHTPMVLEEIPTRISLNTIPKAIVDALVNDMRKTWTCTIWCT